MSPRVLIFIKYSILLVKNVVKFVKFDLKVAFRLRNFLNSPTLWEMRTQIIQINKFKVEDVHAPYTNQEMPIFT